VHNTKPQDDPVHLAELDVKTGAEMKIAPAYIEAPSHPDARRLLDHYTACMAKGGFAMLRDVPSRAIAPLMANLMVVEPVDQGDDFRIRLAGSGLLKRYGFDVSGYRLSDLYGADIFIHYRSTLQETIRAGAPVLVHIKVSDTERDRFSIEYVCVPIRAPDRQSNWILVGGFHQS